MGRGRKTRLKNIRERTGLDAQAVLRISRDRGEFVTVIAKLWRGATAPEGGKNKF